MDRFERSVNQAIAHLQSLPQQTSNISPALNSSNLEQMEATGEDSDYLGVQSLKDTIKVVKSVHSIYGSIFEPDRRSVARMEGDVSSDDSEPDEDMDGEKWPMDDVAGVPGPPYLSAKSTGPGIPDPADDPARTGNYPTKILALYKQEFQGYADREYAKGNYATAEGYQKLAFDYGVSLEKANHAAFASI